MTRPRTFVLRAMLSQVFAAGIYIYGMFTSHLLDVAPSTEYCPPRAGTRSLYLTWSWAPLSHKCHWPGASVTELVPGYVNPLALSGVIGFVLCLVLAVRAQARIERAEALADDESDPDHEGGLSGG